jgi:tRNA G10  N-methylase Trm11
MTEINSLFLLGRQPELGLAELESLYGSGAIAPFSENFVVSSLEIKDIDFTRLGGAVKLLKPIATLETTNWKAIEKHLLQHTPQHAAQLGEGKLHLGLSVYGLDVSLLDIQATSLRIKKAVRATGRSVRVVPNQAQTLSSAQVLHNHLAGENGWELVLIRHGDSTLLAQTIAEQDINAYAKRDQNRPKRDARVGMLPPKLAQIITNLAVGQKKVSTVLDPFCGTGVLLQEAALMGYNIYGSDIEPRMIEYTAANLEWLNQTHKLQGLDATLQTGDATMHTWDEKFDVVACEGYLGQPFTGFPTREKLTSVTHTCNQIAKGFLKNIGEQIPAGTRLAIALPAWRRSNGELTRLKLLDDIEEMGYNRVSFAHVRTEDLLYYRTDQVVARELLVITRK